MNCAPSRPLQQPANTLPLPHPKTLLHPNVFPHLSADRAAVPSLLTEHQQTLLHHNPFALLTSKGALHPPSPEPTRTNGSLRRYRPPTQASEIVFYSGITSFFITMSATRTCGLRPSTVSCSSASPAKASI